MLAKLIVWGEDRHRACAGLLAALGDCEVAGVSTNLAFLERVVAHAAFSSGDLDTGLVDKHREALFPPAGATPPRALLAAALAEHFAQRDAVEAAAATSEDPHSPWNAGDGWWPNRASFGVTLRFADGDVVHDVDVRQREPGSFDLVLPSGGVAASIVRDGTRLLIYADGEPFAASVVPLGEDRQVFARGLRRRLGFVDPLAHAGEEQPHAGHLMAPMSGAIVAVLVKPGDRVDAGAALCVLEAMKMEHTIVAPAPGVVTAVNCAVGDRVAEGADLVGLEDAP
jgi:3-methylcrotonyl-CoA carboxylase alpha subunit